MAPSQRERPVGRSGSVDLNAKPKKENGKKHGTRDAASGAPRARTRRPKKQSTESDGRFADSGAGAGRASPARPATPRGVAVSILHRVLEGDAWAAPLLAAAHRTRQDDPRDVALITHICYGTLRTLPQLDQLLAPHLRAPDRLDGLLRTALRAAVYQLRFLDRVPAFAVVDETVKLVREARGARLAGLANAVLRKIAKEVEETARPSETLPIPPWLEEVFVRGLGVTRTHAFVRGRAVPPPIGLRMRGDRAALLERIASSGGSAHECVRILEAGTLASSAALLWRGADPTQLRGYQEGQFVVQEQGSQAVVEALPLAPHDRVLDACAGRGGKALFMADRLAPAGHVTVVDWLEEKLAVLVQEAERLGLPSSMWALRAIDLTVGTGDLAPGSFDGVLLDAPCTGLGTIHRRPELLLRIQPADLRQRAERQLALLGRVAPLVRPGGWLTYVVCSPSREEGPEVIAHFLATHSEFALERVPAADADGLVRLGPWAGDSDAYQWARLRRSVVGDGAFDTPVPRS